MKVTIDVRDGRDIGRQLDRAGDRADRHTERALDRSGRMVSAGVAADSDPEAVGRGPGSRPTVTASEGEVTIAVGGAWRADRVPWARWGRTPTPMSGDPPPRPYIRGEADQRQAAIERLLLDATLDGYRPAVHRARAR